jgi:hypothetical protein
MSGMAENELSKDDRAYGVKCTVTVGEDDNGDPMLLLDVDATLVDSDQDFSLTLGVTALTVELLTAS